MVHDIGIRPAEEKYGMSNGRLQEQEGPFYARKMLGELGFEEADINRICYLVGHHHTLHIPQELRIRSRGTERHSASN